MAFTLERRDEQGGVLERWFEGSFELAAAMPLYASTDYPYLRLVDPYSDTYFSSYQMEAVIPELERLARETPESPVAQVIAMAIRCRDDRGTYVVFIGD
jgi:hypothetical protein